MKVVILAGGLGTRISEESALRPKPMVEIGEKPILWHIMKHYSAYGYHEFIICLGYKQYMIKEFFADYFLHTSDITFDLEENRMEVHNKSAEPWRVTLIDTGLNTMTGGRIKRIGRFLEDAPFMLTYGDGVSDVNLDSLLSFHKKEGKLATITAVKPEGRFGVMDVDENLVRSFREKKSIDSGWINGGFMVMEPQVLDYIEGDSTVLEQEPLEKLACCGQLSAYRHEGFWKCMDTMRDKSQLEEMWAKQNAPWKIWE